MILRFISAKCAALENSVEDKIKGQTVVCPSNVMNLWLIINKEKLMRAIVDIDLVMKLIRFKAHITVYYTYLYLYIYYICTIYIIYNTTYKIHCNIAYFTLPKKSILFLLYILFLFRFFGNFG